MIENDNALKFLIENGCIWKANRNSKIHAFLTSEKHSDTYMNLSILNNPKKIKDLLCMFPNDEEIDCFCGQSYGSISYGIIMAEIFEKDFIFTEKDSFGKQSIRRYADIVRKYNTICMVEDVLTTGNTTVRAMEVLRGIKKFNFKIRTVVNRSEQDYLKLGSEDIKIENLVSISFRLWEYNNCELCKKGSFALAPKPNWGVFLNDMCSDR